MSSNEIPDKYHVRGPNAAHTGVREVDVFPEQIASCLNPSLSEIEQSILSILRTIPSSLLEDVTNNGIYLVGGSSCLRGIEVRFSKNIGIKCQVSDKPELAIVRGAAMAL